MRDPELQVIIPMVFVHLKSINIFTRAFWPWLPTLHWCQGQGYPGPTCGHEMDPVSSTKAATDPTKPSNPSTPEWSVCCRMLIFHPGVPAPRDSSGHHLSQWLTVHISASALVSADKPQLTGSGPEDRGIQKSRLRDLQEAVPLR